MNYLSEYYKNQCDKLNYKINKLYNFKNLLESQTNKTNAINIADTDGSASNQTNNNFAGLLGSGWTPPTQWRGFRFGRFADETQLSFRDYLRSISNQQHHFDADPLYLDIPIVNAANPTAIADMPTNLGYAPYKPAGFAVPKNNSPVIQLGLKNGLQTSINGIPLPPGVFWDPYNQSFYTISLPTPGYPYGILMTFNGTQWVPYTGPAWANPFGFPSGPQYYYPDYPMDPSNPNYNAPIPGDDIPDGWEDAPDA